MNSGLQVMARMGESFTFTLLRFRIQLLDQGEMGCFPYGAEGFWSEGCVIYLA